MSLPNGTCKSKENAKNLLLGFCFSVASAGVSLPANGLSIEEREALDLSEYRVNDPDASYFEIDTRMALLDETDNPMLLQQSAQLASGPSCRQLLDIPPLDGMIRLPSFYPMPQEWREASQPLFQFEDSVATLAGAYVASGDKYYADCLVSFLEQWASREALMDFYYISSSPQAWFATESMIFAAAMAYSIVRAEISDRPQALDIIDSWLNRMAHQHFAIPGHPDNSCCNNHFYRRALYATMVGVLTEDNHLFRQGVSAIYSALHDLNEANAFRLEITRGRRATHYQNYALLYLIPNMQIIARQGYDIFELEVDGRSIHDAVEFALDIFEDSSALGDMAPQEQYQGFFQDDQYFAWMEIYLSRFDNPRMEEFLQSQRPTFNRGAGGFTTFYFMDPEAQQHKELEEERQPMAIK